MIYICWIIIKNVGKKCLCGISLKIGLLVLGDFWALSVKSEKVGGLFKIYNTMKLVYLLMLACGWVVLMSIQT